MAEVSIEVIDKRIVVRKPGTDFSVYEKRPENSHAVLPREWLDPRTAPPAITEFRAQAFRAAIAKAREIGWIV